MSNAWINPLDLPDDDGYVGLGAVVARTNIQDQYLSRFVSGLDGYPVLSENLRFRGEPSEYYAMRIHQDDVDEFVRRIESYRAQCTAAWQANGLIE